MMAGKELDEIVATKVMGLSMNSKGHWTDSSGKVIYYSNNTYSEDDIWLPDYSTDVAAAFSLIHERHLFYEVSIFWDGFDGDAYCEFKADNKQVKAMGFNPAHAICLAALKAKGVEV